jgi:hypothetical protein
MSMEPQSEQKQDNRPAYEPPCAVGLSDVNRGCGDGSAATGGCGNGRGATQSCGDGGGVPTR